MRLPALKMLDQLDVKNKNVFLRLDLNVPLQGTNILDLTRLETCLPTLEFLISGQARVVIASHLGRPQGQVNSDFSLEPVGNALTHMIKKEVYFFSEHQRMPATDLFDQNSSAQLVLLENLRFHPEETSSAPVPAFCQQLGRGIDYYVFDAFGVSHRKHASVYGLPQWLGYDKCYAGYQVNREYQTLTSLFRSPPSPLFIVMGGSKIAGKLDALLSLLPHAHHAIIGGAMAIPFLKTLGYSTGAHHFSNKECELARMILRNSADYPVKIHLPLDHMLAESCDEQANTSESESQNIPPDMWALDIGPKTREYFTNVLAEKATILWNGPVGVYEWPNCGLGSKTIAEAIASNPGTSIVGGGDSLALISRYGLRKSMTHLSTGGGAMLDFLGQKKLPGLLALTTH
ncbi:MAG: phosphoglycerate kinase [Proteobacteria bacterium]|nr:phosphoglycerate kinase [Pseudomonadota bacterium]